MRVACLLVPDLPLRAELRASPELVGAPVVVVSGPDSRAQVVAVSPEAAAAGVRVQTSLVQARAACAELHVRVASPALEVAAREALRDVALSFSPRVELLPRAGGVFAGEAAVWLDAGGVSSLFHSEAGFASAVAARSEALGLPACVALASSRDVSHLAARRLASAPQARAQRAAGERSSGRSAAYPETPNRGHAAQRAAGERSSGRSAAYPEVPSRGYAAQRAAAERSATLVLAPDDEAAFLAPLPVDLLDPDDELAQRLTRLGIRTLRDLLRLPRRALATRLGPGALELADRARGRADGLPLARPETDRLEEAAELEWPVDRLEPLLFALRGPLSRLLQRLEARGLGCGPLDLELGLAGGGRDARRVGVAAPTRDPRVLMRLVSLSLESQPPTAPVERIALGTEGRATRTDQLDLFRPRGPSPADLARTVAELEALCGPGLVGAPRVADEHRPDAFELGRFRPTARSDVGATPPGVGPAARALRPPAPARVRLNRGQPSWVGSPVGSGTVLRCAGPWRTTGRWWSRETHYAFDHFDVQLECGTLVRLRHDRLRGIWQIDAIYD